MSSNIQLTQSATNGGFLSGLVEASVEMPPDGLNGQCVVHYGGKYIKYEMKVKVKNGKRDGEGVIINDGMPYIRVEYMNGEITGVVKRINEYGVVDLRGNLLNGVEDGFFEEYDNNGNVVWRGYYKNGKRDDCIMSRIVRKGKNDERSVESGEFYEMDETGIVKALCLYVNGRKSRLLASYNGSTMIEFDANEKRAYEGEFKGNVENGFVREGKGREYVNGGKTVLYSGEWKNGKRNGVGKGKMTTKSGKEVCSGNRMFGMNAIVCFVAIIAGIVALSTTFPHTVQPPTTPPPTTRPLVGTVVIPSELAPNPLTIETITITNGLCSSYNGTEFILRGLPALKSIVIGDYCFGSVRLFELDGLSELESVVIGKRSFRSLGGERSNGSCRIVNCPKLKSIQIGYGSFSDYHSFEMSNLPSLESIEFGEDCFKYAPSFSLIGLIV